MNKQTVLDHPPYIKVVKKGFVRPDGTEVKDYFILEYPTWVNVIALTENNHILLVEQFRPGANKILTGLPSGSVNYEIDDNPEEAIRRELREETGYGAGEFIHIGTGYPNPAHQNNLVLSYLTIGVKKQGEATTDQEEGTKLKRIPFMDHVKNVFNNPTETTDHSIYTAALSLAINHILKSKHPQLKTLKQDILAYLTGE